MVTNQTKPDFSKLNSSIYFYSFCSSCCVQVSVNYTWPHRKYSLNIDWKTWLPDISVNIEAVFVICYTILKNKLSPWEIVILYKELLALRAYSYPFFSLRTYCSKNINYAKNNFLLATEETVGQMYSCSLQSHWFWKAATVEKSK